VWVVAQKPKTPIPNPQSPIPNPQMNSFFFSRLKKLIQNN
jgi:hypothetical protein